MIKNILGIDYEVLDAKEMITLADSFVMNKIGTGHGEGKLYVGQLNDDTKKFWDDFNKSSFECFMLKNDLQEYLCAAQNEFLSPSQPYQDTQRLRQSYEGLSSTISLSDLQKLDFSIFRTTTNPPRVYMNSTNANFQLIRELGIPNISYVSILKLKELSSSNIFYYFKLFIDYNPDDLENREFSESEQVEEVELDINLSRTEKEAVKKARKGQGVFREKLLDECPFCPITLVNDERLLIASHIKPWAAPGITNKERIDPKNGIPLTPTYDKLFDRGFISFTDDKRMMVSPWLSPMNQKRLNIADGEKVSHLPFDEKRKSYLEYHRNNIFKK